MVQGLVLVGIIAGVIVSVLVLVAVYNLIDNAVQASRLKKRNATTEPVYLFSSL